MYIYIVFRTWWYGSSRTPTVSGTNSSKCQHWNSRRNVVGSQVLTAMIMKSSVFWYTSVVYVECQQMFQTNILPRSSRPKNKPSKKPTWSKYQADNFQGRRWRPRCYIPDDRTLQTSMLLKITWIYKIEEKIQTEVKTYENNVMYLRRLQ
jgi:hypothetical protein